MGTVDTKGPQGCSISNATGTVLPGQPMLACDDTGSGWAGLRQLVQLRPQVVKLDRALVTNVDKDPTRRALVSGLRHFTNEIGALLLAEGIESVEELDTLVALGVDLGQGYLLGSPMPMEAIARRPDAAEVASV